MHPTLRTAIIAHRSKMSGAQKRISLSQRFTWQYPRRAEKKAEVFVGKLFGGIVSPSLHYLKTHIPDYEQYRGVSRIDTAVDVIIDNIDAMYESVVTQIDKIKDNDIEAIVAVVIAITLSEWDRFTIKYAGVPVPIPLDLEIYKQEFISQFRKMIRDDIDKFYIQIKALLDKGLAAKEVYQKMYTTIFERFKSLVINRAKYTARNLIANAQSRLSRLLFTAAGFPDYVWNVNMDEVLRGNPNGKYANKIPSHFVMAGIICKWDNDGIYSTDGVTFIPRTALMEFKAPGMAPNCRCWGSPFIKKDLETIDNAW